MTPNKNVHHRAQIAGLDVGHLFSAIQPLPGTLTDFTGFVDLTFKKIALLKTSSFIFCVTLLITALSRQSFSLIHDKL